jgi:hypothetical protein
VFLCFFFFFSPFSFYFIVFIFTYMCIHCLCLPLLQPLIPPQSFSLEDDT